MCNNIIVIRIITLLTINKDKVLISEYVNVLVAAVGYLRLREHGSRCISIVGICYQATTEEDI
jgi:hypothetical protein